jgi:polar amino acid transport system substrate-binding protein
MYGFLHRLLGPLLVLALCLGSSAAPAEESSAGRLEQILESGVLRVGLSGNQPPLNMRNKKGEIVGLEVDLVKALAGSMGLEPKFVTMPFAELLPALEMGDLDLVISGMTITPQRNARVAFAGPYFISGKSLLTRSNTIANAEDPGALDSPKRRYAALSGSTSVQFVKELLPSAKLVTTPDYDSAVKMVMEDKVDALVADYPICILSVLRYPEAGLSALTTPFTTEPLGIALPADDHLFLNLVQNYLTTLRETGLLTRFKAKWFSPGAWVAELP